MDDPARAPYEEGVSPAEPTATPKPSKLAIALLVTPAILASIAMGAHFLRWSMVPMFSLGLAMPFLLLVERVWSVRIVQGWLTFGAVMWVSTTSDILSRRLLRGEPWLRMVLILAGVALFTLVAAALLEAPALKRRRERGFGLWRTS